VDPDRRLSDHLSARGSAHASFAIILTSALVAFVTAYVLSRGTSLERGRDRAASGDHLTSAGWPVANEAAATLLEMINVATLGLFPSCPTHTRCERG